MYNEVVLPYASLIAIKVWRQKNQSKIVLFIPSKTYGASLDLIQKMSPVYNVFYCALLLNLNPTDEITSVSINSFSYYLSQML